MKVLSFVASNSKFAYPSDNTISLFGWSTATFSLVSVYQVRTVFLASFVMFTLNKKFSQAIMIEMANVLLHTFDLSSKAFLEILKSTTLFKKETVSDHNLF